ncbi:MAG: metallopeptidase TldD-related protein [Acidobacteriota bacterium]|nr:metallopeptidase TldD-related protein [Acidobacteriota bacterium]
MPTTADIKQLHSLEVITDRMERLLQNSPADETEIVWLEARKAYARRQRSRIDTKTGPERTVLVRVLDRGRVGSFRTGTDEPGELASGIRSAIAQSRAREPLSGLPHLPGDESAPGATGPLHDPEIAEMSRGKAKAYLSELPLKQENAHLHWCEARVAVFNSRGVRRRTEVTSASLEIRTGRRPGAARATDAARTFALIDPKALLAEAREHHAGRDVLAPPTDSVPVVFSPIATIQLCDLLNTTSFSAKAYYDGTSFLREHMGIQVFDRRFNLCDDGTDPSGLAFPFDLEGSAKRSVDLISKGAPQTPTLDQRQAAVLGLPATAHAIGGNDARAENLFLLPGDESEPELFGAADGGLWVGWLEGIENLDPLRVRFRARARGVRAIGDGRLDRGVPDLVLEDSLLRAFSALLGIGNRPVRRASGDGYLGGISAPAVAVTGVQVRAT